MKWKIHFWRLANLLSIRKRSGERARGPGLNWQKGCVRFQTRLKTGPGASWCVTPASVPANPRDMPGWARPFGSNPRFSFSGFSILVAVRYAIVMCKILMLVNHSLYLFHWLPL